jgi:hypothetical protein
VIGGARNGAVRGMIGSAIVTGELAGADQVFSHLTITENRVG